MSSQQGEVMAVTAATTAASPPVVTIEDAVFPRDLPSDDEKIFLSIFGHAGGWKWAMHECRSVSFAPSTFWSTPAPNQDDRENNEQCLALHQFLTTRVLEYLFGTTKVHPNLKRSAAEQAKKRQVPALTVYILASNASKSIEPTVATATAAVDPLTSTSSSRTAGQGDIERDVVTLFKDVPVRLLRLLPEHFFAVEQHHHGGVIHPFMTTERLAALYGAKGNHPSSRGILIIHGGDVLSYSAMDHQGKIVGGGVSPGIGMRFRSLFDYSAEEDFPLVHWSDLRAKIKEYVHRKDIVQPKKRSFVDTFSVDIEDSVVAGVISEVSVHARNIVKQFLDLVSPVVEADTSVEPPRTPAIVLLEGHDNEFLFDLLGDNSSEICPMEPGVTIPKKPQVEYCCRKNLTAYGIQRLLVVQSRHASVCDPDETIRAEIIGLRGARIHTDSVKVKTTKASSRRGTFVAIRRGHSFDDDMFEFLYDDNGEKDYVDVTGLYDSIRLYLEVGEDGPDVNTKKWAKTKRIETVAVEKTLADASESVRHRKVELDGAQTRDGTVLGVLAKGESEGIADVTAKDKGENLEKKTGKKRGGKRRREYNEPEEFLGRRVAKYFDGELYFGTLDHIASEDKNDPLWHVTYDDDDEEDFEYNQVKAALLLYEEMQSEDPKHNLPAKRARKGEQ
ncbi:hypothetical protein IV203_016214 [Nitzschia inconspicua]|uniref:PTM/DIR17-like Tudor domain-containing protein n=1 Tax=Nitzschia inconspicua TaxID=303405 RepID=A0A9K3KPH5_9STRA|nr:hypothetical protein IV203_016214 [Nitzschia inconspicua]